MIIAFMKRYICILAAALSLSSCYDRDVNVSAPAVGELENIDYQIDDDTLRVNWSLPANSEVLRVQVNSTDGKIITDKNPSSFKYGVIKVGKEYKFTFKVIDESGNISLGKTIYFVREGGTAVNDVQAKQIDGTNNVHLSWTLPKETLRKVEVRYDGKTVELGGTVTECEIKDLDSKKYSFGVISFNDKGQSSETTYKDIRVGSTKFAFIGVAPTYEDFKKSADDDELAAGYWLFEKSGLQAEYVSFADIAAGKNLNDFRALWWIYDSDKGADLPAEAKTAAVVSAIKSFHTQGGGLLLNTHAVAYLWEIGRLTDVYNKTVGSAAGFHNNDTWSMNVQIGNHNESTHPVYAGVELTLNTPTQKLINLLGAGWKEDHNYVQVEVPAYYGLGNADEKAYETFRSKGIRILSMWSHIQDYYMFANFECEPMNGFQGTAIAIGVGCFEWSQNKPDGSKVNPYTEGLNMNACQGNIELITKNSLEYLKTK